MKTAEIVLTKTLIVMFNLQLFADEQTLNANKTNDSSMATSIKEFRDNELLENARANLIFDQFGIKVPINKSNQAEFRRYNTFAKAMTPLTEGVTPAGSKFGQSKITVNTKQYGDYTTVTDRLELESYDPVISAATEELGAAGAETYNALTRDVLSTGTAVAYASQQNSDNTVTEIISRKDLSATCLFTKELAKKAATHLKKQKAPRFEGDCYIGLIHPSVSEDFRDKEFIDTVKYGAGIEKIYNGEIGKYEKIRFVENTECKVHAPEKILGIDNKFIVKTAATSSTTVSVLPVNESVNDELQAITGKTIKVWANGEEKTVSGIAYDSTNECYTLTFSSAVTLAQGKLICGQGAGKDGSATYDTIILGKGAYGIIDPYGENFEMIIHDKSEVPPLNLYSTIGYKFCHAAIILQQERILRIESGSSYSAVDEAN